MAPENLPIPAQRYGTTIPQHGHAREDRHTPDRAGGEYGGTGMGGWQAVPTRVRLCQSCFRRQVRYTQVCIDGDLDPVEEPARSAASSLSMVPGWCPIPILGALDEFVDLGPGTAPGRRGR